MGKTSDGKTSQGYTETLTIKGFPAAKIYDSSNNEAGLIVLILDRFVVQMFGHNFADSEVPELVEIAESHNLEGIAELGK